MSLRENTQIYHPVNIERYLEILKTEYGAQEHPQKDGAFLIDGLPFYMPQMAEGYVFVLGFNMMALPHALLRALIDYPELIPPETKVRWTAEQELVMEADMEVVRNQLAKSPWLETDPHERTFPVRSISRADLQWVGFSDEEIAQLSDHDMRQIAQLMDSAPDAFWDELVHHTQKILAGKRRT